jgi:hypothetical protein
MIPAHIIEVRREICARCDAPCDAYQAGQIDHTAPDAACPRVWSGRWGLYLSSTPGLGTRLQKNIHAVLDVLPMPDATRNAIKSCGGCAQRRDVLDRAFPGKPDVPAS